MYTNYFSFSSLPFTNMPDPAFLYMSEQHREAFAHLLYSVNSGDSFVVLTGEIGTGKTLLCHCLFNQMPPEIHSAFIQHNHCNTLQLLEEICRKFNISCPPNAQDNIVLLERIQQHLYTQGKEEQYVIVIDEAQNLTIEALEHLRLLTNCETPKQRLLQVVLVGQPELLTLLNKPKLRHLKQRIGAHYHLNNLTEPDVAAYVKHRLAIAGTSKQLFPTRTIKKLTKLSQGIPRLINTICDRTLLATYAQNRAQACPKTLIKAASEVFCVTKNTTGNEKLRYAAMITIFIITIVALAGIFGIPQAWTQKIAKMWQQNSQSVQQTGTLFPKEQPNFPTNFNMR